MEYSSSTTESRPFMPSMPNLGKRVVVIVCAGMRMGRERKNLEMVSMECRYPVRNLPVAFCVLVARYFDLYDDWNQVQAGREVKKWVQRICEREILVDFVELKNLRSFLVLQVEDREIAMNFLQFFSFLKMFHFGKKWTWLAKCTDPTRSQELRSPLLPRWFWSPNVLTRTLSTSTYNFCVSRKLVSTKLLFVVGKLFFFQSDSEFGHLHRSHREVQKQNFPAVAIFK